MIATKRGRNCARRKSLMSSRKRKPRPASPRLGQESVGDAALVEQLDDRACSPPARDPAASVGPRDDCHIGTRQRQLAHQHQPGRSRRRKSHRMIGRRIGVRAQAISRDTARMSFLPAIDGAGALARAGLSKSLAHHISKVREICPRALPASQQQVREPSTARCWRRSNSWGLSVPLPSSHNSSPRRAGHIALRRLPDPHHVAPLPPSRPHPQRCDQSFTPSAIAFHARASCTND